MLRSTNYVDVETSIAHSCWTSSKRVNRILENGYRKASGNVVLFFSVTGR